MKHRFALRKLGRTPAHRRALLRNMATSMILNERVETTVPKAKELRRVVERLITLGKNDTLHARRKALAYLQPINKSLEGNAQKTTAVHKLFTDLAPRFQERPGGYTRVVRGRKNPVGKRLDGRRPGDNAPMAIIEFVAEEVTKKARKKRRVTRKAPVEAAVVAEAVEAKSETAETNETT